MSIFKTAAAFVLLSSLAGAAMATENTNWEKHHPRRDQVNDRLENQDQRIDQETQARRHHAGASRDAAQGRPHDSPGRT